MDPGEYLKANDGKIIDSLPPFFSSFDFHFLVNDCLNDHRITRIDALPFNTERFRVINFTCLLTPNFPIIFYSNLHIIFFFLSDISHKSILFQRQSTFSRGELGQISSRHSWKKTKLRFWNFGPSRNLWRWKQDLLTREVWHFKVKKISTSIW